MAPGERFGRRATTNDPVDRDVRDSPHHIEGIGFNVIGEIFYRRRGAGGLRRDHRGTFWPKGHARTSGASMIVGYVGSSGRLDIALARFARLYADRPR
jgi:hypothetical protein